MSAVLSKQRGMYFDEFQVGQQVITAGRTVSEADIVAFAGLSGDFNQMHVDATYSQASFFGQRVAHGLLVLSIASGLMVQTGVLEGTVIAFREIENWKFSKPVFIGDTVHALLEVTETRAMRRLGSGSVTIDVSVKNQHDDTVMKGALVVLVAERPSG
jgi:acyl dehydratase